MLLPEVNRESAFVQFLHVGDTGDVKQHLTEPVLKSKAKEQIGLAEVIRSDKIKLY